MYVWACTKRYYFYVDHFLAFQKEKCTFAAIKLNKTMI